MAGIIVSSAYALSPGSLAQAWKPIIGWHSVLTAANMQADETAIGYPASNLGNPSTAEGWRGTTTATQYVTGLSDVSEIDYVGIAGHNLSSGNITATLEGLAPDGDPEEPEDWSELGSFLPADDGPLLFRLPATYLAGIRLRLEPDAVVPRIAVIKAGRLMVLHRGLPPGHQPLPFARQQTMANLRSPGGGYLGSVVTASQLASSIDQRNLDPAWYRTHFEPFRKAQPDPFFWAWAPQDHPDEVGYCWATSDPVPVVNQRTGEIDISFSIGGAVR